MALLFGSSLLASQHFGQSPYPQRHRAPSEIAFQGLPVQFRPPVFAHGFTCVLGTVDIFFPDDGACTCKCLLQDVLVTTKVPHTVRLNLKFFTGVVRQPAKIPHWGNWNEETANYLLTPSFVLTRHPG